MAISKWVCTGVAIIDGVDAGVVDQLAPVGDEAGRGMPAAGAVARAVGEKSAIAATTCSSRISAVARARFGPQYP